MTFDAATRVLDDAITERVFPGAVVEVGTSAGPVATLARGALTYDEGASPVSASTIYDLASLTKVLATSAIAAQQVSARLLSLDAPVSTWSEGWSGPDRKAVTIRHLLEHASGLPAHRPWFMAHRGRAAYERAIAQEALIYPPGTQSVYSDAGFILLGLILERAGGGTLDAQFDAWRTSALGTGVAMRYLPPEGWLARTAPTEADPWRGRTLVGEVHDENAAALGGVAGHAGLFGTAAAVGLAARWWMADAARSPVVAAFMRRGEVPGSSRALGWDTALPTSSCGTRMSPTAAGHTGFTGTSLWIDRERDVYVVFLSNRVHPSRDGDAMARVRPALHDAVADDLSRG
ncbi:MAG: serine hydrolase domain-containing protein [Vicinamibacterales bacterium]